MTQIILPHTYHAQQMIADRTSAGALEDSPVEQVAKSRTRRKKKS